MRHLRRILTWAAPFLGALVCFALGSELWSDGHVTYALPNGEGHDVLPGRLDAARVAWTMTAPAALGAVMLLLRPRRMPQRGWVIAWVCVIVAAVAVAVIAYLVAGSQAMPDY